VVRLEGDRRRDDRRPRSAWWLRFSASSNRSTAKPGRGSAWSSISWRSRVGVVARRTGPPAAASTDLRIDSLSTRGAVAAGARRRWPRGRRPVGPVLGAEGGRTAGVPRRPPRSASSRRPPACTSRVRPVASSRCTGQCSSSPHVVGYLARAGGYRPRSRSTPRLRRPGQRARRRSSVPRKVAGPETAGSTSDSTSRRCAGRRGLAGGPRRASNPARCKGCSAPAGEPASVAGAMLVGQDVDGRAEMRSVPPAPPHPCLSNARL